MVVADRFCFGSIPGREQIEIREGENAFDAICRHYLETNLCARFMSGDKIDQRHSTMDFGRYPAYKLGIPFAAIPTLSSSDGFTANICSIIIDGQKKSIPMAIIQWIAKVCGLTLTFEHVVVIGIVCLTIYCIFSLMDVQLAGKAQLAMHAAGAPTRYSRLNYPVDAKTVTWAITNCHLMRNRFSVIDLLHFSGVWDGAFVQMLLDRAEKLDAGL